MGDKEKKEEVVKDNEKEKKEEIVENENVKEKNDNPQEKDYNNNKVEEKSLEDEVKDARDKKFLAETIVKQDERLTRIEDSINKLLSFMKVNTNEFTSSEISKTNPNNQSEDSKYYFDLDKVSKKW